MRGDAQPDLCQRLPIAERGRSLFKLRRCLEVPVEVTVVNVKGGATI